MKEKTIKVNYNPNKPEAANGTKPNSPVMFTDAFEFSGSDDMITYTTLNDGTFNMLTEVLISYTEEPVRNKFTIKCNKLFIDDVDKWLDEIFSNTYIENKSFPTEQFEYMGNTFDLEHHKILDDNLDSYGVIGFNGVYLEITKRQ